MSLAKTNRVPALFLLLIILFAGPVVRAETITFSQAVEQGLSQHSDIRDLQEEISNLKRDIKKEKADMGWVIDIESSYNSGYLSGTDKSDVIRVSTPGKRPYFSLTPELEIYDNHPFEFENIDDKWDLSLNLQQELFPRNPVQQEKNIYLLKSNIQQLNNKLKHLQETKLIDWLDQYLQILRLKQELEVVKLDYKLAEEKLQTMYRKEELQETSENNVLAARIEMEQVKNELKQIRNDLNYRQREWYLELGLPKKQGVEFSDKPEVVDKIRERISDISLKLEDRTVMEKRILENNIDLQDNLRERKEIRKKIQWSQKQDRPEVNLTGNYKYREEEWDLGIYVTYNLFDGGKKQLQYEGYNQEIKNLKRQYDKKVKALNIQLDKYLQQVKMERFKLREKELAYEKTRLDRDSYKNQFQQGLITKNELREKEILLKRTGLSLQAARDNLLLSRLKLYNLLGISIIK